MTAATVQPRVSDEKRVTWAELFFDLVFVFAVTRAAQLLHADHSALGVVRALVAFVPLYWIWVGNTIHANLHDVDTDRDRIGMFAVGLCSLLLAIALPQPKVLNLASTMVSFWTLIWSFMTSPHSGAPTIPVPTPSSSFLKLPMFRGLLK